MIRCRSALVDGAFVDNITIEVDDAGRIGRIVRGATEPATPASPDDLSLGAVVPGFANTHSHLFHRALRGRTGGDDFWSWRQGMYRIANLLEPMSYRRLARAVYAEMLEAGYTRVGEFHYVHHRPDGSPYPHHEMEIAIAEGAAEAGIRLTLLDTCYLHGGVSEGGVGVPLAPEQMRFGDGSVQGWLERWHGLRDDLARSFPEVTLGAALHSVRAVAPDEMAVAVSGLPADAPVHLHLSEQPRENQECLAVTGLTPTGVLDRAGALSARTTVVHATHLSDDDIARIAGSGTTVSLCPTTEGDLGDGIAPIGALSAAGVPLCIGTDEDVVTDPFTELRMVETTARLASGRRGVLDADRLWLAGTADGLHSLNPDRYPSASSGPDRRPGLRVGDPADLVEIDPSSTRLAGVDPLRWPLAAAAGDVVTTVVGGAVVPRRDPAELRGILAELEGAR